MKKEQDNLTIRISNEVRDKLQVLADETEITLSALIRSILINYLKK